METEDGTHLLLPADARVEDGQPIIVGVRPEHLRVASEGMHCEIELTEPLGREVLLYGKIGGSPICVAPGDRLLIAAGAHIDLAYRPEDACVFDAATEKNLRHDAH